MARIIKLMGRMILSMCSVVFGGVLNMLFVKTPVYKKLKRPIDGGRNWRDGRRVFGDNKTFAGDHGVSGLHGPFAESPRPLPPVGALPPP